MRLSKFQLHLSIFSSNPLIKKNYSIIKTKIREMILEQKITYLLIGLTIIAVIFRGCKTLLE